ncbi:MAG: primosomal protein N' [Bacteroidota bacterium]|nr:primosomal protein N' [Bacteroidota bacterium]
MRFAVVALPLHFKYHSGGLEGLTYSIPDEFETRALIGTRVSVPLGKRLTTGILVGLTDKAPQGVEHIRAIADILDAKPVFDEQFLEWTKWIASYYLSSWGEVLEAALPQGLKPETKSKAVVTAEDLDSEIARIKKRTPKRAEILKRLSEYPNGVFISHFAKRSKLKGVYAHIAALEAEGLVRIEQPVSNLTKPKTHRIVRLSYELENDTDALSHALLELERSQKQASVLFKLLQQKQLHPDEPFTVELLKKASDASAATIAALAKRGFIRFEHEAIKSDNIRKAPLAEHDIANLTFTSEQRKATQIIEDAYRNSEAKTFLLHGITGSGKTEVYISLAKKVLDSGHGVLILVPEISLTPQLIERFERRLSSDNYTKIAVLHSRMSLAERYASWQMLAKGETKIAIGARSAVFAPIKDLKMIIVDEEHEITYKQYDQTPRYNARDAAIMRAHSLGGVAVLGSATPSLESYYNATQGKYTLITLTKRALDAKLPSVRTIDMRRKPMRKEQIAKQSSISLELKNAIDERLAKKQGTVLLQNRRGFSTYLGCSDCGDVVMCPNCAVSMTWHSVGNNMRCHYCGFTTPKNQSCPTCGSEKLFLGGVGTQRVEEELREIFPAIRIARMDMDTTARKGAYEKILTSFARGESDVLLGTQMVAKGLDFPRVTLVGVINADTSLALPDLRSSERTFQLLTQVSGRAGRTEELAGEVLIQTLQPEHPAIRHTITHDYESFYNEEILLRKEALYPPFSRLVLVEFRGKREQSVREAAFGFGTLLPKTGSFYELLGPAEAAIKKLRNEYRWHLLIKDKRSSDPGGEKIRRLLAGAIELYQKRYANAAVTVTVDVDVQGVL